MIFPNSRHQFDSGIPQLRDIYEKYSDTFGGDKGILHSYIEVYEQLFYNRHNISFLEVGVFRGHSIKMWSEYFIDSFVLGIDINLGRLEFEPEGFQVIKCDSTDPYTISFSGPFDYIIDDGSHKIDAQIKTFKNLFPMLKSGGIYIIEDAFNIDLDRNSFLSLHSNVEILDRRHIKNRFDDVLVIIRK